MPASPLPVFAISLPRFKQRYAYIRSHLEARFGSGYEIVGVYGAEAEADSVSDHGLTPGQIGCALSHLAVYKLMIERNLRWAFIVEDDAILPKNICQILENIRHHLPDRGVIQLYNWNGGSTECSTHMSIKIHGYMLYHPARISELGSTLAYMIGSEAAKGILSVNYPVKSTADNWQFFFKQGAFESARILHPSPIAVMPFETTVLPVNYGNTYVGKLILLAKRTVLFPLVVIRRRIQTMVRGRDVKLSDRPSEIAVTQ
jgi:glycosyl transferase family 25